MKAVQRHVLLTVGLVGSLIATGWVASQDEPERESAPAPKKARAAPAETAAASARRENRPAVQEPPGELALDKLKRGHASAKSAALFPSASWEPPPPRVAAGPPTAPVAPPLPFAYFGKMDEDGRTIVFLLEGERNHLVKQGDVIDGRYRVEEIGEASMVLTYIPLGQRQTLNLAASP